MRKRILATLLAAVLVVGLLPMAALAAEGYTVTQVTEMKYSSVGFKSRKSFVEGMADVISDGKEGFINTEGEEVIPCRYDDVDIFSEGLAAVELNGKYGYIDKTGREIIPCQYDYASCFMDGVAVVELHSEDDNTVYEQAVINKAGETIIDFGMYEFCQIAGPNSFFTWGFSGGVAAVANGTGLIDKTGREIFPTGKYQLMSYEGKGDEWGGPVEGLIVIGPVVEGEEDPFGYGIITTTGEEVLPCEYDEILIMNASHVAAKKDGKFSVLDITTGEEVLPDQYDDISHLFNYRFTGTVADLYLTSQNNETCGVIDANGKEILPCTHQNISLYSEGYMTAGGDGEGEIVFDATGKQLFILDEKYDLAGDFSEGYRVVGIDSGKTRKVADSEATMSIYNVGFIDMAGNEVIPCSKYNDARGFSHGIAAVGVEDGTDKMISRDPFTTYGMGWVTCKWGAVDTTGREIIPCLYDEVTPLANGLIRIGEGETWRKKYGIVDQTGKEILPCEYDDIEEWADTDLICVRKNDKYGFISITKDPATNTAYPSTQKVDVDGKAIEFQCYALKDANGNDTNYIKLRDLADILNGSAVQFEVGWNGNVTITTGKDYTKNGSEQKTPFSGQRTYQEVTAPTLVNGEARDLAAFTLTDDNGGGYTYYKLRDLGAALGFKVDWTAERGIFIETK